MFKGVSRSSACKSTVAIVSIREWQQLAPLGHADAPCDELDQLLGPAGSDFIKAILERSSVPGSGTIATIFGVLTVLIAASGVSGEMQTALNMTFKAKPSDKPISSLMRPRREPGSRRRARLHAGSLADCQCRAVSVGQFFQVLLADKILLAVS